ncbi:hypothetical protein GLAREA_06399 [Glarea lozoyensis ATCC 20868]|uniref:Ubiquitin 3 binding protein But2 C-terminal domain-containing protein n=1 Tax=Glarea lozoyensis (strain ATCC 20868 / MF5171) TaxID=1116229 RepID=S3DMR8_GLAL2|nr:uncharacterized protein GLAREA_06399 [Glarea lozoyensis ATCC 20868]EPE33386.1 hypothetical protein GLAREA_06399 [Glarea lozoyensis ATCC 20868]
MISAALLLLPALAVASPLNSAYTPLERRDAGPPLDQITIVDSGYSGNGCPQGSVSTTLSPDKTLITFGFDKFQTFIAPGLSPAEKTKQCQLHLSLKYPGGFQYAVTDATYHGYARLDASVTGTFLSTYYFSQSASQTCTTRSSISGPGWLLGDVYTKHDQVETTATIWSPCGATGLLNINNRIALTSSTASGTGEVSNDDATVAFTQQAHVSWRQCVPGGSTGGGTFTPGPGGVVEDRDAPTSAADPPPQFSIIPGGGTVVTPGGGSTGPISPSPSNVWTIGPGSTTITHG